ncbi:unnamed protein product [Oppiella nova]|uniref:BTB domain-containing protein n=1 Tax=Oppiella nova TaxID=334625 RepID=A0A7R9MDI9_9ACAR|nr:unnamed protein product [Oppiella nova]CAG2174992.1 unnamed protein product [Oppiella nova]
MSSDTSHAFCLKLNNHQRFLTGALAQLYANEALVDVTLSAEGQQLRAHQLVLAACSPYFRRLFADTHHRPVHYPIVVIKGMPFADLKAIVEFIYWGEVCIPRRQLQSLLANGAELQVKGLHEFDMDNWADSAGAAIDDDEQEVAAEDEEEEVVDESIGGDKQAVKSVGKGRLNACESDENGAVSARKQTRKLRGRAGPSKAANGDANGTDTWPTSIALLMDWDVNGSEAKKSMTDDSPTSSSSTGSNSGDTSVPFNVVDQSMSIDVKHIVNMKDNETEEDNTADSCSSGESTGAAVGNDIDSDDPFPLNLDMDSKGQPIRGTSSPPKQTDSGQNTLELNLPAPVALDESSDDLSSDTMDTAIDTPVIAEGRPMVVKRLSTKGSSKKRVQRVSKAGIPRKGNSVRSQKKFKCPECHKIYLSPQNMREHLHNTHTNPDQKYVCTIGVLEGGY